MNVQEQVGVMGELATAMRDPVFYRWHTFINSLFLYHKDLQPVYNENQVALNLDGVKINSVALSSEGHEEENTLYTMWQQREVDVSKGLDFAPRGQLFLRFTHLQHRAFTYNIQLLNSGPPRLATCRIFLAPKNDEHGQPFKLVDQRSMFIEMDKFLVKLKPGRNTINRNSKDSTLTIPLDRIFQDDSGPQLNNASFSGCGYPEHLLVPRGSVNGTLSQLFVMFSDYESVKMPDEEEVSDDPESANMPVNLCGLRPNSYHDKRSLGFPFDRMPRAGVVLLSQFLTPNMAVADVTIKFTDRVLPPAPAHRHQSTIDIY